MAQYDGSIRLNTNIDSSGIKNGFSNMHNSFKKIDSEISHAKNSFESLSNTIKKLGSVIAAAFAFGKLVQFGKEAIELGSDLEEVQNVVDVTFTTMSNKVEEFSKKSAISAGLSETMAKRYVGTFGAMSKSFGFAEKDAYKMSTALTQLTGDVASFYNISQDEAYTKLKSVFTGETETLKDLGVVMTQSALDAYAMANGFGKTTSAMSEQEKVALRYQFVIQQLSGASGDFIRTSDSWANQVRILKLQFESLKATIGQGLINVFTPIIKTINILLSKLSAAANAFKSFTQLITGNKSGNSGSVGFPKSVGEEIGEGYDQASKGAENLASANEKVAKSSKKANKEANKQFSTLDKLNNLSSQKTDSNTNGSGGSSGGGESSGSAQIFDYGTLETGETVVDHLSNSLSSIWDVFQKAWKSKGKSVVNSAKKAFSSLKKSVKSIGDTLIEVFTNETGLEWLKSFLELLRSMFDVIESISTAFSTAWNSGAGFENVTAFFTMFTNINGLLTSIGDSFSRVFSNGTGAAIWTNILGIITGVYNIIGNLAKSIQTAWDTAGLGDSIWQGILNIVNIILGTLHNIADSTAEWAAQLDFTPLLTSIDTLLKAIEPLTENIGYGLEWFWNNVLLPMSSWVIEEAIPVFLGMVSAAIGVLNAVIEAFKPYGEWLWNTFLKPLGEWTGGVIVSAIESVAKMLDSLSNSISNNKGKVSDFTDILDNTLSPAMNFLSDTVIPDLKKMWEDLENALRPFNEFLSGVFNDTWKELITPALEYLYETVLPTLEETFENLWNDVLKPFGDFLSDTLEPAVKIVSEVLDMLWKKVVLPLAKDIEYILSKAFGGLAEVLNKTVFPVVKDCIEKFKFLWNKVLSPIATYLWNTFKPLVEGAFSSIGSIIDGISTSFGGFIDFITGVFAGDWEKAWNGIKETFSGIWKTIEGVAKDPINAVIGFINEMISGIAEGINNLISMLNKFKVDIPDNPFTGKGLSIGFNLQEIKVPQIPKLATGTVVPPNKEFLAVLGDNKREHEVVSPLSTIEQAVENVLQKNKGAGNGKITIEIPIVLDGRQISKVVQDYDREYFERTGKPLFTY